MSFSAPGFFPRHRLKQFPKVFSFFPASRKRNIPIFCGRMERPMKQALNIWILGGDLRQAYLAALLREDGHRIQTFALEQVPPTLSLPCADSLDGLSQAELVILPMPVTAGSDEILFSPLSVHTVPLTHILRELTPRQWICAGRVSPAVAALFQERGLSIYDYFTREELIVANCVPTAEGAIQLAMEHLPITIHQAKVLVTGCGRVGKLTAQRFAALGAKVSVAARKYEQLAWAECHGFTPVPLVQMPRQLSQYQIILNTVPALLFGPEELAALAPECLVLDLASNPGGVDMQSAERLGRKVIHALSLPGKVAPASAGQIIRDAIYHTLQDAGAIGR